MKRARVCKKVEPLLPLYAGRDLDEEHSRLVAAHLQSCTECTLAADEYARAGQLLQRYESPFFSDEIYGDIREQVLNEIERKSRATVSRAVFSQLFLALVQPRMRWLTAALLLALSITALYLSRKPSRQVTNNQQVAVRMGESDTNQSAGSSSLANKGQGEMAARRRPITGKRKANAGVVATRRSRELEKTTKVHSSTTDRVVQRVDGLQPSSAPATLRVEMQTSDRNIRIIWLSGPRPGAGGSNGSKGI